MSELTKILPAVALRGMTILPGMVVHFDVSREKSIRAVEESMMDEQHIFLVADSEDALEAYEDYLHEIHENAEIAGKYLWDEQSGSEEDLINEINGMTPHVVISALSFEKHMQLLCCNKAMLNADLWIARPDGSPGYTAPRGLARLAQKFLYKQIMREEP